MKKGIPVSKCLMLFILISILAGIVAAETTFSTGSYISVSTSASVQGTINETVSLTKSNIGGGLEKTELRNSYTSVNPFGLSWRSHLTVNSDKEAIWVDYSRTGELPWLSWRQFLGK